MKQKWNCRPMFSNRNPQHQNISLRKQELIKSLRLKIMTCSTMILRCSQFWMSCLTRLLSRLLWRLKKSTNLKKFVSSNTNITSVDSLKIPIGNKKLSVRFQGSSRRIRPLIMLAKRESNNSILCRSFSAWILPRPSSPRISKPACST